MRLPQTIFLICSLTSLAATGAANVEQAERRDLVAETAALFAKRPFVHDITISPDGKTLMVAAESDQDQTITFLDAASLQALGVMEFDARWRLGQTTWISNDSLVVSPFYQPMRRNYSLPSGNLTLVHINGRPPRVLVGPLARANTTGALAGRAKDKSKAVLLDSLPNRKDWILVQTFDLVSTGFAEVNIRSGRFRNRTTAPSRFCRFSVNDKGQVRYCSVQDLKTDVTTIYELTRAGWNEILVSEKPTRALVFGHSLDGKSPLVLADTGSAGTFGLFTLETYLKGGAPLYFDPVFDFWSLKGFRGSGVYAIANPKPLPSYIYPETGNPVARILAGVHRSLVDAFPSQFVEIGSHDADFENLIVRVSGATSPGSFFLVDRKKNETRHLSDSMPWLRDRSLADKLPFTFTAGDGLTLHGFLTRAISENPKQAPSVVLVHGGPHGPFDTYHYDREIQFLAALGLNVVQVNFRGSGGFGQAFIESGYRQWSRLMVDDVVAGFQSLAGREIGRDACIYGASYGAFNALSTAYRKPDIFLCAAGHVGVYSLPGMYRYGDIPETAEGVAYLKRVIGDDQEVLRADSPAFNAERINVPVFLSAGDDDVRAPRRQTKVMAAALKAAGKQVREMYVDREGHGFASAENESERLTALGDFFADHLTMSIR